MHWINSFSLLCAAILEKYNLWQDYASLQESVLKMPTRELKAVFKDKKLNKLWLKAEQQGFSGEHPSNISALTYFGYCTDYLAKRTSS